MASFPLPTLPLKFGIHGSLLTLTGGVATALPPPTLPVLAPPLSLSVSQGHSSQISSPSWWLATLPGG